MGAVVLAVVEIVGVGIAVGCVRRTVLAVGEVFGF